MKTICEKFECPTKVGCDEYEVSHKRKPCTFEKARDDCGEATCLRCLHTDICPPVFGKYPSFSDIHRLVCNPGHTMGCKEKTHKDCGYYPPFRSSFCKIFEQNCKEKFKPEPAVTEDGMPALSFVTFIVPKKVIDDYISQLEIKLRQLQRGRTLSRPLMEIIDGDREIRRLHLLIMQYFPGYSGDVGAISSAFRYAVEGYVEGELRRVGAIA
jgi:hypothetical protein